MIIDFVNPTHEAPGDSRRDVGPWHRWLARLVASILTMPVFPRASRRVLAVDRTLTRANPVRVFRRGAVRLPEGAARPDTAWTIARGLRSTSLHAASTAFGMSRSSPLSTSTPFHHAPGVESPLDGTMVAIDEKRNSHQREPAGDPGRDPRGRPVR